MTASAITIIITTNIGEMSTQFQQKVRIDNLEEDLALLGKRQTREIFLMVTGQLDEKLKEVVPRQWKVVGSERRTVVFEHGTVSFKRRIYRDEEGKRRKPLDELLGLEPYARTSRHVREKGCSLAAETTFRKAAQLLSYCTNSEFGAATILRMLRRTADAVEEQEEKNQDSEAGHITSSVLYGEADGLWINLQREAQRRAEVKIGIMYTGKKQIGKRRFRCENKVSMTQIGGTTLEWQIKLRELAYRTYNLERTRLLVVGGDGSQWAKQSFDLLGLPKTHLLDRYHIAQNVKLGFGDVLDTRGLLKQLFSHGFKAVQKQLEDIIGQSAGQTKKLRMSVYHYLKNNEEGLLDLDKRPIPQVPFSKLGAIEGNVDKLVRQRMKGRGFCWTFKGAKAMLAILRHKEELANHSFCYVPIKSEVKKMKKCPKPKKKYDYLPPLYSIPILQGPQKSETWVQLLRYKLNYDLSINSFA